MTAIMPVIGYSDNSFEFFRRQLEEQDAARRERIPGRNVRLMARQLVEQEVPAIALDVEDGRGVDSQELDWKGGAGESEWATEGSPRGGI